MSSNPTPQATDQKTSSSVFPDELPEQQTYEVPALAPQQDYTAQQLVLDDAAMAKVEKLANWMSGGKVTTPKHLQGNAADCMAVVSQALIWKMNPWAVAQKTHLTPSGQLGYEAQLINAVITTNAPIISRPDYEFIGDWDKILGRVKEMKGQNGGKYYVADWGEKDEEGLGVIVSCQLRGEAEPRNMQVMLKQCWPRFSTQWATDPQQQICFAGIRKWARRHTPDVILGVYTPDELDENYDGIRDINPAPQRATPPGRTRPADLAKQRQQQQVNVLPSETLLKAARAEADKGNEAFRAWWRKQKIDDRTALQNVPVEMQDFQKRANDADQKAADAAEAEKRRKAAATPQASQAEIDEFVQGMDRAAAKPGNDYVAE